MASDYTAAYPTSDYGYGTTTSYSNGQTQDTTSAAAATPSYSSYAGYSQPTTGTDSSSYYGTSNYYQGGYDGGRGGAGRGRGGYRGRGGGGYRGGGGSRDARPVVSTKLYVGNLPETVRKADLQEMFDKYGKVTECDIVTNFAFIHFDSAEDAKAAVMGLNGAELGGQNIKVQLSTSRVRQKPGMGGDKGCFRCGEDGHWSKDCPKASPEERASYSSRGGRDSDGGRGGGAPHGGPPPPQDRYAPPPHDPYAAPDPYYDPYYRYPPPPPRYSPYPDPYDRRRPMPPPPPRDPYHDPYRDPYARPPPDYYRRTPPADPYYDYYSRAPAYPPPAATSTSDPAPHEG